LTAKPVNPKSHFKHP